MNEKEIYELQKLLYVWLSRFEKRSLNSIKESCNYLAESHKITEGNAMWNFFWPLVLSGVADHTGNGFYALTEPLILNYNSHYCYINVLPKGCNAQEMTIGIYISEILSNDRDLKVVEVCPYSILKRFPSIDKVVDGFPKSLQDVNELKYYNWKTRKGVAKLEEGGIKRLFSIPDQLYIREIPDRTINPDAFAIACCYSRVVNGENNGIYNQKNKTLTINSFGVPFILYRVLLLETMASRLMPKNTDKTYMFEGVSASVVKELNRILCNSIKYE